MDHPRRKGHSSILSARKIKQNLSQTKPTLPKPSQTKQTSPKPNQIDIPKTKQNFKKTGQRQNETYSTVE